MSAARKAQGLMVDAASDDAAKLSEQRWVNVSGAALIAECSEETIRRAARSGELHGSQREGKNPATGKPVRGARWKFRPVCVDAYVEGVPCEHQEERRPVSLDAWRTRSSSGRA